MQRNVVFGSTVALLTALMASQSWANSIYRWIGPDGSIHFTDRPPERADQSRVDLPQLNLADSPSPPKIRAKTSKRKRAPKQRAPRDAMFHLETKRAEKCHRSKQQLRQVRHQRRAGYSAAEGRKLTQRRQRHQADIRFYCD